LDAVLTTFIHFFVNFAQKKMNSTPKNFYWDLYEKYKTFRAKAFQLLNHVDEHVDEFRSLMVEKFQIVKTAA